MAVQKSAFQHADMAPSDMLERAARSVGVDLSDEPVDEAMFSTRWIDNVPREVQAIEEPEPPGDVALFFGFLVAVLLIVALLTGVGVLFLGWWNAVPA